MAGQSPTRQNRPAMFALSGTRSSHATSSKDEARRPTNAQYLTAARSYGTYVRSLLSQESRLAPLDKALQKHVSGSCAENSRNLTIVEFGTSSGTTIHGKGLEAVLRKVDDMKKDDPLPDLIGLCILVEDIYAAEIDAFGSSLNIHPSFFLQYLESASLDNFQNVSSINLTSFLPPRRPGGTEAHFPFQRVVHLGEGTKVSSLPYRLETSGNVKRTVRRLPVMEGQSLGIARASFSLVSKTLPNGRWTVLMLIDSLSHDVVLPTATSDSIFNSPSLKIKPLSYRQSHKRLEHLPNYSSWYDILSRNRSGDINQAPLSLTSEISDMLLQLDVNGLDSTHILFELAQSPARVVVDEWMFYALLMWRCIKNFEFSQASGKLVRVPGRSIDEETSDYIKELHRWCRRGEQTIFKLETLKRFLEQCPNNQRNNKLRDLLQDVGHLMTQIQQYKVLLETKVPILMSVVQLMDSQRAAKEAIHVKQLTVVAVVFLPLSYVAALFSMADKFSVDGHYFWVYWAAALPLLSVVLFISLPQVQIWIGRSGWFR